MAQPPEQRAQVFRCFVCQGVSAVMKGWRGGEGGSERRTGGNMNRKPVNLVTLQCALSLVFSGSDSGLGEKKRLR